MGHFYQPTHTLTHQVSGNHTIEEAERWQGSEDEQKLCLLNITWLLYLWNPSSHGSHHKTKPTEFQHGWKYTAFQVLPGRENYSFWRVWPRVSFPCFSGWPHTMYTWIMLIGLNEFRKSSYEVGRSMREGYLGGVRRVSGVIWSHFLFCTCIKFQNI